MNRWATIAGLLIALNLLLLADRALEVRPESMALSVLDLTHGAHAPVPAYHVGAENTHAELLRAVQGLTDPANPFGASKTERLQADNLLHAMRSCMRRMLWLQFRLLERLPNEQRPAYRQMLLDRTLEAAREDERGLRDRLDLALGRDVAPREPTPQEWQPDQESLERMEAWRDLFDMPTVGRHLFLEGANRAMVLWLTRERRPEDAARIRQMALELLALGEEIEHYRAPLNTLVQSLPSYVPGEAVGASAADTSFLDVYAALPR